MGFPFYNVYDNIYVRVNAQNADRSDYFVDDLSLVEIGSTRKPVDVPVETHARWRPPAAEAERQPIYTVPPVKKPLGKPSKLLSFDGTFESCKDVPDATQASEAIKDANGAAMFSGVARIVDAPKDWYGVEGGGKCLRMSPAQSFTLQERNLALKPDTWYRVGCMVYGNPWQVYFNIAGEHPYTKDGLKNTDYGTSFCLGHCWGGGYEFCTLCRKCNTLLSGYSMGPLKDGSRADWAYIMQGDWAPVPDKCWTAGCDGVKDERNPASDLVPESNRRRFWGWTYIYQDFQTGAYTGKMRNGVDYWNMSFICSAVTTYIDDIELYEITGEFGDAVEGAE
jgi:hypothetical protein